MTWRRRLGRYRNALFGDRLGAALFLGALCWVALTWRIGFFITDSYAVANTLVNVADGHLYIETVEYSITLGSSQPGLHISNGRVYGRNYGQVYLALPVYVVLDLLSLVADIRVLALASVSGAGLGVAHQFGGVLDRRAEAVLIGSVVVTVAFLSNLAAASSLQPRWAALLALQTTTAVGAGVVAIGLYRLLWATSGRRVGFVVGVLAVVGTPIGLWATIPKRHVLTAAFAVVTLLAFYHSRRGNETAHAVAYGTAAFATSVHGAEGAVLLAVMLPVDLLTVPDVDGRTVTAAATGLAVGLIPFLVTNTLISGNPLLPPRWLTSFDGGSIGPGGVVQTSSGGRNGQSAIRQAGVATVLASGGVLNALIEEITGIVRASTDLQRLYHVFVRSGNVPGVRYRLNDFAVVELSLFESMPLGLGTFLGASALVQAARDASSNPVSTLRRGVASLRTPTVAVDILALGYLLALTASYMSRLPLFSQITVRYLLPTMPLWLYLFGRAAPIRRTVSGAASASLSVLALGVTVGMASLVVVLSWLDPALGEAMQFQALVNLAVGMGATVLVAAGDVVDRPTVAGIGVGAMGGAGGALVVLAGVVYFPYGPALLPVTAWLADLIALF